MNRKTQINMIHDILKNIESDRMRNDIENIFYSYFSKEENFNTLELEYIKRNNLSYKEFSDKYDVSRELTYHDLCNFFGYEE